MVGKWSDACNVISHLMAAYQGCFNLIDQLPPRWTNMYINDGDYPYTLKN